MVSPVESSSPLGGQSTLNALDWATVLPGLLRDPLECIEQEIEKRTMMKTPRHALLKALALTAVTALAGLASAKPITAQDLDIEIDRERMVEFVRVHIAVNDARDEFHGAVARVHDPEGRIRAREEVEAALEAILEEAEMTREDYDQVTLMISLDGDLRTMFEEVTVELEEGGTGD